MNITYIDLLIRIKNGYMIGKDSIESPHTKFKERILIILKKLGYIKDFSVDKKNRSLITVILTYENGASVFTDIKIFSKPGRKTYLKANEIRPNKSQIFSRVFSTSKGLMTDTEAKKNKVGGELLFEIW
ncbi:MAG: 30S ribosomal protein S8 [bacterium]